jgi:hypothetical protein
MTEAEWLASDDATAMIRYVRGLVSDRKLRLWACACVRRVWPLIPHELGRRAVLAVERYVDGRAKEQELRTIADAFYPCGFYNATYDHPATRAAHCPLYVERVEHAGRFALLARKRFERSGESAVQAELVRHIAGNPYRLQEAVGSWPATVVELAEALYMGEDYAFALHDALLEAGQVEVAEHFGQGAHHPRGCWAVDLILGKT